MPAVTFSAISSHSKRPCRRSGSMSLASQHPGNLILHCGCYRSGQQTMLANAFRAHLAEFGIVVVQGIRHVCELIETVSPRISLIFPPWCVRLFGRSSRS